MRNKWNPMGIGLCPDGLTRDRYGRVFETDSAPYHAKRKTTRNPNILAQVVVHRDKTEKLNSTLTKQSDRCSLPGN